MMHEEQWVMTEDILEYHQMARANMAHLCPAKLSWGKNVVLWSLRVYVLVMVAVVTLEVVALAHP